MSIMRQENKLIMIRTQREKPGPLSSSNAPKQSMTDNGYGGTVMARGCRSGKMEVSTRVSGRIIRLKEKGNSLILMEMSMKENGSIIKLMAMELIDMQMVTFMKETGKIFYNTAMEKRYQLKETLKESI